MLLSIVVRHFLSSETDELTHCSFDPFWRYELLILVYNNGGTHTKPFPLPHSTRFRQLAPRTPLHMNYPTGTPNTLEVDLPWHAPSRNQLPRAFYSARWRAPGSGGRSISRSAHPTISSAISRRVYAFHPCRWPPSCKRFLVGQLYR